MKNKKTVLIADRDTQFVRQVQATLERDYHVVVSAESEDVLDTALSIEADMVILQWHGSHGETLVRWRQERGASPHFVTLFESVKQVRESGVDDGRITECLVRPVNTGELRSLIATLLSDERDAGESVPLQGRLEHFAPADLFQVLSLNRESGCLYVRTEIPEVKGAVYVVEGAIVDASLGGVRGTKALFRILDWERGLFEFVSGQASESVSIRGSVDRLLMQALREKDELNEARPSLPRANDRVTPTLCLQEAVEHHEGVAIDVFREVGMGGQVGRLLDESEWTDGVFYRELLGLITQGTLLWERSPVEEISGTLSPGDLQAALSLLAGAVEGERDGAPSKVLMLAETQEMLMRAGGALGDLPGAVIATDPQWERGGFGTLGQVYLREDVCLEVLGFVATGVLRPIAFGLLEGCVLAMGIRAGEERPGPEYVEFLRDVRTRFEVPVVEVRPEALERMDRVFGATLRVITRKS